jgi:hypothetical protein
MFVQKLHFSGFPITARASAIRNFLLKISCLTLLNEVPEPRNRGEKFSRFFSAQKSNFTEKNKTQKLIFLPERFIME